MSSKIAWKIAKSIITLALMLSNIPQMTSVLLAIVLNLNVIRMGGFTTYSHAKNPKLA